LYGINRARNWNEFLDSLSYHVAPSLNYIYADAGGNIGYSLAGRVPIRPQPHSLGPLPGWSGEGEWKGYVPFNELPRIYNPPEGLIATANDRIADASYPYHLSDLFEPPYRILRIKELLTEKSTLSPEEMAAMHRDVVSVHATRMIRDLRADLEKSAGNRPSLTGAVKSLVEWDGNCTANSPEAALFHALHQRLMRNLLAADLGEDLYLSYTELFNQALLPVEEIMRDPQSPWFDSSPRQGIVERSLSEACEELRRRLGPDTKKWSWGRLHTVTLEHPFGKSKILAPLFSLGPFPSGGDAATINMGFYRHSNPYAHTIGPSLRMIFDVGNWQETHCILPSGQAGHIFSPHYGDQTDLWRRTEYIRLDHTAEAAKAWPTLTLIPGSAAR
ncbi:MAG: penicillin acylase family protein, partial [Candidatus Binatia bacterium]